MLTERTHGASTSLDALVIAAVASACRREPSSINHATAVLDVQMDSLTMVAIVARIEAAYDVELAPDEVAVLFEVETVGALISAIARFLSRRQDGSGSS